MARISGACVLVADDERAIRDALRMILEYEGYRVVEATDGEQVLPVARAEHPDAVLLDIRMPRLSGLEALRKLREAYPELPVLMISGHGTIETAVEALRGGAQDFLEKPLEREVVLRRLAGILERARLREEVASARVGDDLRWKLVGQSAPMQRVFELIERTGPTQATVLITGESGTGKELVARAIHARSPRAEAPFIKVNCAAIPDELIESELFGHEKGAFTGASLRQRGRFARAHGGTLLLDEIGDMSLRTQAKVLRALQDGEIEPLGAGRPVHVDVRVIAATNKDLRTEMEAGRFREDLYYRLSVLPIQLPPLRARREDIPPLIEHLTAQICAENNFRPRRFSRAAIQALAERPWPGNVRELRNTLERALILSTGETIDVGELPEAEAAAQGDGEAWLAAPTLREFKERSERVYLLGKLEEHGWNITRTAQAIGTPRSNLYKRLEHHGLARLAAVRDRETAP
ncbi:MAG: sigma-54-dependent Fis family transcriptional regulator [Acidobacteria bacterium]|nr:sigma-54-dependent Fis family transcriptional regulator [Acidobacteriota bacterium]